MKDVGKGRIGQSQIGRAIRKDACSHVQGDDHEARDNWRSFALDLVQDDTTQGFGVGLRDTAGQGHRGGGPKAIPGGVADWDSLLGAEEDFTHRAMRVCQRGCRLGIVDEKGFLPQSLLPTGHGRSHLDNDR